MQDDSRGFDDYMDSRHPSVDAFLSQPSSTIAAVPLTLYNHSILHNLPTVTILPQPWNTWKNPSPFSGGATTFYYTSTARLTLTSLKPSGSRIVQDPPDGQLISLVSPNVAAPITSSFPVPVPPSLMPDASGPKKSPPYDPPEGPPLLEWEEYPTEEVGMVDSLEEEVMVMAEISPGEMKEDLPTYTVWNEAYIMLVSCIDYALDMTCIQSVSQCFIVGGIL